MTKKRSNSMTKKRSNSMTKKSDKRTPEPLAIAAIKEALNAARYTVKRATCDVDRLTSEYPEGTHRLVAIEMLKALSKLDDAAHIIAAYEVVMSPHRK
jgi:hypothetical protein